MKLGGWWRIWIVLTILYSGAVLAVYVAIWPEMTDVRFGPWTRYQLSQESQALLAATPPQESPAISLRAPNEQTFRLPINTTEAQVAAFARDIDRVLEAELAARRSSMWTVLAVILLAPPLTLLALGFSIAWIRRGFSRGQAAA